MALKPYQRRGTPDKEDGQRLIPAEELYQLMQQPYMQRAVELVNRVEGKPRAVQVLFHRADEQAARLAREERWLMKRQREKLRGRA